MPESKRRKPKYTAPTPPKNPTAARGSGKPPSPTWYVALMSGLMGVGVLVVLARFAFNLDNWVTGVGLAAIAGGFLMTTNYR